MSSDITPDAKTVPKGIPKLPERHGKIYVHKDQSPMRWCYKYRYIVDQIYDDGDIRRINSDYSRFKFLAILYAKNDLRHYLKTDQIVYEKEWLI